MMKVTKKLFQWMCPPMRTVPEPANTHAIKDPMAELLDQMGAANSLQTDHAVIEGYLTFAADSKTNCDDAAGALISMAYKVYLLKPHLGELLLRKALEPIYFLGIDEPSELPNWTASYRKRVRRFNPGWDDPAFAWIDGLVLTKPESLHETFEHLRTFGQADYADLPG